MNTEPREEARSLLDRVRVPEHRAGESPDEAAWIDVIRKMDEIYAELVHYQVELEEKNSALEDAHRFIASVLVSMSDVLIVCDMAGNVQEANDALTRLTGRSTASVSGRPLRELFSESSRAVVDELPCRLRTDAVHDCEVSLAGEGETEVPLAINCTNRYDADGRQVGTVLIGRPLGELRLAYRELNQAHEELKQAQHQLLQSEKMASLGRLVAGVAHELNNPISFVYGNIHVLDRYCKRIHDYLDAVHKPAPEDEQQALRRKLRIDHIADDMESLIVGTTEGAERISEIVQDLKIFSAAQRGKKERFDLATVVRNGVQWAVKGARVRIDVRFSLPESIPLTGYAGQFHQVALNLAQNAIDAMAESPAPVLEVEGTLVEREVEVEFRDNGAGIAPAHLPNLFDPFFTTKPVGQGTGLGLSISYGIVNEHGGTLSAYNRDGGGAVFRIRVPLAAGD